ncbi:MAG: ABC transporter ATP-binding protein [Candidatus Ancillula sp.]|jgi:putative ABC transport system ATP-binding protein|nr:ABC transporter ATP-binding protein [Candidatus Ancillula sp.]
MMDKYIIKAGALVKAFGDKKNGELTYALNGANLGVYEGEILAIMGPSGSGKSTLLYALTGIIGINSGRIEIDGQDILKIKDSELTALRRTKFGFVFQFNKLVPELTALDNVALPLLLNGVKRKHAYEEAENWLERVGMKDFANKSATVLSGGQQQRVAIARALVIKPKIVFADEPTGALDAMNSENVMRLFVTIAKQTGTTVVLVTHEPSIAAYADREVIVRDGKVLSNV